MTVTEAPPSAPSGATTPEARRELRGLPAVLGTGDHKTIGRLWIGAAAFFLLVTVVAGALLGFERINVDELDVLGRGHVLQFFSLYRVGLAFLVVLPFFTGLATFVVPLQVGAATIAFPRAAAAALWAWLGGAVLLLLSYAIDGGPGGGDPEAVELWLLAYGLVVVGLLLATVCVATTVIALRAPRMSLQQVPPFAWSMLVAGTIWLLSLPVLLAGLLLAYLDHRYGQQLFAVDDELFARLEWVVAQPQVYAMAIPVLGVAAEIVPVSTGTRQRHRGALWAGIGGFGIFAFGAWAQPFYRPELVQEAVYVGFAFLIGLPLLVVLGGLADGVARGKATVRPALLLTGPALVLLLAAVGAGAAAVVEPLDLQATTWLVGQMNLVFTAALVAVAAALCWWAPKLWGRHVPPLVGVGAGLALAGGGLLVAVGQCITGALDQPIAFEAFDPRNGVEALNAVSAVGAVVLALGAGLLVLALVRVTSAKAPADDAGDPWGGQTLEWSAPSPPPVGNFAGPVPEVTTATPLAAEEGGE